MCIRDRDQPPEIARLRILAARFRSAICATDPSEVDPEVRFIVAGFPKDACGAGDGAERGDAVRAGRLARVARMLVVPHAVKTYQRVWSSYKIRDSSFESQALKCGHSARMRASPISRTARIPKSGFSYPGIIDSIRFDGAV